MLEAKNLSLTLGKDILKKINFRIKKGDFTLIIGKNGAGKSSLMKIIDGLLAYNGSIRLNGIEIRDLPRKKLAKSVSYQPQNIDFSMPVTVRDILYSGRYPYRSVFSSYDRYDEKIVCDVAAEFRLGDLLDREMKTLSGGERKRALIASSYIQDVELFLFDEPFSSLDPGETANTLKILKYLKAKGKSVIVVSHNFSVFNKTADTVIALKGGEILFSGEYSGISKILNSTFDMNFKNMDTEEGVEN